MIGILVFLASVAAGLAQYYPGMGPPAVGYGPPNVRLPGSVYPPVPNYYPGYFSPGPQPYNSMAMGVAGAGMNPLQPSLPMPISASENANENANTNVNINAASYRRSLHQPSKENSANRNSNSNSNINA